MTQSNLASFWEALSKKQEELSRSPRALDSIAVERSADSLEEATYSSVPARLRWTLCWRTARDSVKSGGPLAADRARSLKAKPFGTSAAPGR